MSSFFEILLPSLLPIVGIGPLILTIIYWQWKNGHRRSPLTKDLLRSPGYSLRQKIDDQNSDLMGYFVVGISMPMFLCIGFLLTKGPPSAKIFMGIVLAVTLVIGEIILIRKMLSLLDARRKLLLGMEGELAVGEELNQLMLEGCRVFHDVPTDYGNIDHVVISLSGVYAVNTKMVSKNVDQNGGVDVVADHSRNVIRFPGFEYQIDTDAFETESRWLSQFLSSAVGQQIKVESMLALPGWFIKNRISRGPVYVFNPINPRKFFIHNRQVISGPLQQQIAHQLEQRCRTVERSFPNKRGWKQKS